MESQRANSFFLYLIDEETLGKNNFDINYRALT